MIEAKSHLTAVDLVEMRLPGLPSTESGIIRLAKREGWEWRKRAGRGGGKEYAVAKLPKAVRDPVRTYLLMQQIEKEHQYDHDGSGEGRYLQLGIGSGVSTDILSGDHAVKGGGGNGKFQPGRAGLEPIAPATGRNVVVAGTLYASNRGAAEIGATPDATRAGVDRDLRPRGVPRLPGDDKRADGGGVDGSRAGGNGVQTPVAHLGQSPGKPSVQGQDPLANLNQRQRETHIAIDRIVNFVNAYGGSVESALEHLNAEHAAANLTVGMCWAYEHCWYKKRADSRLTRNTYNKWIKNYKKRGHYAPMKVEKDFSVKPWYPLLFALMQRPQGSVKKWVHAQIEQQWEPAWGDTPPSYDVMCTAIREKLSQSDLLKGRYSGSQLRSKKFYQHRTAEGLAPADEVHGDGWCTHFTCPHPETKEPVTYEVWHFHDVATKFTTPPGIGMSEKFEVISKGLENFCQVFGQPLIVQMDSTKVVKGSDRFTKARESLEERLGCTIVHPISVGNSQANGICENFNTYYDRRSKELATYSGKTMDGLTYKRVRKITLKMAKAGSSDDYLKLKNEAERMGKGRVFDSMEEGIEWINRITDEANDKPHSSLKKVRDQESGRLRHQTPREALIEHLASGWEPAALTESQIVDIFRPHTLCKVTRETVSPYGGMRYRNAELLNHWNGKDVIVAYDIHNYSQVWVKDMQGALICVAEFVAATGYRAQTAYDAAEEKRAKARIRLRENQIEQIKARSQNAALEGEFARVKTILDFIDVDDINVKPERELTIHDFLPEKQKEEKESTYADTVMWLYGDKRDETEKEVAADS